MRSRCSNSSACRDRRSASKDYPHQLSGGLRQRVMIAIALACEPKVLLADEPTTALDVTIQAQILRVLDDLEQRLGMATLLVTHDMGVVAGRSKRINVMYAGRIVETGDQPRSSSPRMRHPYTQALLGSIPRLEQDATKPLLSIPGLPPDLTNPPQGCRFAARCQFATEQCRAEEPPLDGDADHKFACWHPVDGPAVITTPLIPPRPPLPRRCWVRVRSSSATGLGRRRARAGAPLAVATARVRPRSNSRCLR